MKPLQEAIRDGAEETYPIIRCAGLYLSVLEWAGEDRLGKETSDRTKLSVASLIEMATKMREPSIGPDAQDSVLRDFRGVSDLYLKRYQMNYASAGEAFGQDVMWKADNDTCQILFSG
jgi:hypothetical protein